MTVMLLALAARHRRHLVQQRRRYRRPDGDMAIFFGN
jgi:hypothetical protein